MDEDIDIEEHDVLDNPVIRTIFPDINVIKKEISQYYDDVPEIKQELEINTSTDKILEDAVEVSTNILQDKSGRQGHEQSCNINHMSKLSENKPETNYNKWTSPFQGTKLILGSKPNKTAEKIKDANVNKSSISLESVVRIPKVVLQDLGEYIYESDRYCKDCKILFSSKPDFEDHKLESHSVKMRSKPAVVKVNNSEEKPNKCNICNSCFNFKSSLFRHFKNVHNNVKNALSTAYTHNQYELSYGTRSETATTISNKYCINVKTGSKETNPDMKEKTTIRNRLTKVNTLTSKCKCTICGSYFSNRANLNRHYRNIHKKKISFRSKYKSNNKCTICGSYFSNRASLNRHYKCVHNKKVSFKSEYGMDGNKSICRATNSSQITTINKTSRSHSKNINPNSKNVCFHCNKQFSDQNSLIEHIYTILESKPNSKQKMKENETKKRETNVKSIRMKDKLIFENQESDESDCSLSKTEKDYFEGDMSRKKIHTVSTTLIKKQTEKVSADRLDNDRFRPNPLRNKRRHDLSDDTNSSDPIVLSADIVKENKKTHDSNSSTKRLKTETKTIKRKHYVSDDMNSSDDDVNSIEVSSIGTDDKINKNQTLHEQKSFNEKRMPETKHTSLRKSDTKNKVKVKLDTDSKIRTTRKKNFSSLYFTPISKNLVSNKNNVNDNFVYECIYCTYIASSSRGYCMHMFGKHKREKVSRINKVIFDRQCKYCPTRTSKKSHNRHLRLRHFEILTKPHYDDVDDQKKELTKPKVPSVKEIQAFVLKTSVFKCIKCDVHFLSSCVARDHEKHMELLINWKCSICKKIFKKNDDRLHLKQHEFSDTVNVYQFDQSELSRLLYNCTKCAIHFTEERYLKHYPNCGSQTTDSVYCKSCDILIDKCGYANHEHYHRKEKNTTDIIVITEDLITKNIVESSKGEKKNSSLKILNNIEIEKSNYPETSNKNEEPNIFGVSHIDKKCDSITKSENITESNYQKGSSKQKASNSQEDPKSKKRFSIQEEKKKNEILNNIATVYSPMNCLTFCHTCKCYLSDIAVNRKSHVEARCSKIPKYTCPKCGLVFTNKTINTHRTYHQKVKGLKLQDFEFFDLNGIQILPPIPEYPSCSNCEVIFVGRNAVKGHICSETEYFICKICNIKLSENASKLHMNFHTYRLPNEIIDLVPRESQPKDIGSENRVKNASQISVHIQKSDKPRTEPQENNVGKSPAYNLVLGDPVLKAETNAVIDTEDIGKSETNARNNVILYTCQSCKISFDTYNKVIEHTQNHFNPDPTIPSSLKVCSRCSLTFETTTYEAHQNLHLNCNIKQLLTFDPTYFTSDNETWIRHIFASVSPSIQKEAIERSIYQHESRIKMEVIQQGPSYLTVFKCNRCGIFINHDCLITHIRENCTKFTGKHPCPVCGLPFISNSARTNHEKIHKQYDNVRLKSYNIVLINCEAHYSYNANILNAMKQYILYQCRVCDGIVDISQRNNHICNVDDLQKCLICGLLVYKDDFQKHTSRHSDLALYNTDHMKVILFGNNELSSSDKKLSPTFEGVICDYRLYKCRKCEECEIDKKLTSKHACTLDDSKWKCPKCMNYISARSIKQHIKMHDTDLEYKVDNFIVINFGSDNSKDPNNSTKTLNIHELDCIADPTVKIVLEENGVSSSDHNIDNNGQSSSNRDKNSVVLYKCACGLHYMDSATAKNHAKLCGPKIKIIRQNCSKCGLKFNPKELFSHILAHHSDKNKTFNYSIIEITNMNYL